MPYLIKNNEKRVILHVLFVSGLPAAFLLEEFGKMFFDFCKESGYTKILKVE